MSARRLLVAWLSPFLLCACSGGSGGDDTPNTGFQLEDLSLQNGAVWQINREIVLRFSEPVDFATVSANTIQIRSLSDVPALGTFTLRDPFTVVFQPHCPTLEDYSDAGLQPGGVGYVLRLPGRDGSSNTVRSATGDPLGLQQSRAFSTPASNQASIVFLDARVGPPAALVREHGSSDPGATRVETGGDPVERVYFENDGGETVLSDPGFVAPLNLYSDRSTRLVFVVAFDQAVSPAADNLSPDRLRLEFRDEGTGGWHALDTRVTLAANCTGTGASVRLEPIGVLPPSSAVRAVILPGFRDLVGEPVLEASEDFAVVPTRAFAFTSLDPADSSGDAYTESFEFGAESPLSFQDAQALLDTPAADWGGGRLSAAFSFEGDGGPNGDFDWIVRAGELFLFDTTRAEVIGGPDGLPATSQIAVEGLLDVRNFTIEAGGEVRVQGPNPLRIRATGDVVIRGRLDLSGFAAKDVVSFGTGNVRELGGAGAAGGGRGGTGNLNVAGPSPRGGSGEGPFGQEGLGGQGGEMGAAPDSSENARRPGGGGGGRFTRDRTGTSTLSNLSLAAEAGTDGNPRSTGAESGQRPARGGASGRGPFIDTSADNDFFGIAPVLEGGEVARLVRGELPGPWAGYGGGAGGNAGKRFPNPNWSITSDEKGGGGGGGAGGLHVQALGRIVLGRFGVVLANGGRGATGANSTFFDHVGGTGGGGSGGHVILESATAVDFTDGGAALDAPPRDVVQAGGPQRRSAANEYVDSCGEDRPFCCPSGCQVYSNGGAGGAGLIQIHVPDPGKAPGTQAPAEILVPSLALAAPDVLDQLTSPPALVLIPTYGRRSKARSRWISIGGADHEPDGSVTRVRFLFDGIDPRTGRIETDGSTVAKRAPLVTEEDLATSTTARILSGGFTLELTGAALAAIRAGTTSGISNDVYLRTPALLEDCAVRMRAGDAAFEDFSIASAVYDEGEVARGDEVLRVEVGGGRPLTAFDPPGAGAIGLELLPRFFRVVTDEVADSLPGTASVSLRFQAAKENAAGRPDEADLLQGWTSDITEFNAKPAGALQFFRYEVEFDLDRDGHGIEPGTAPVTLDFLRIPFVF